MAEISAYKVFARTYRPKTFGDVLGQDVAVQIFKNALQQHTLSHAILLTGIRGIGKTTSARLLAKTLCCLNPVDHVNPCGQCISCKAFDHDYHTDILEMDAASHTSVDDIREIIEGISYAPAYGRYRVYIIDEVHMLSKNAFNALLKTLEEPPAHIQFIFATTEIHKVPETILSRCLQIELRPMDVSVIVQQLIHICTLEKLPYDTHGLTLIAEAAQGSMRDALSILEKVVSFIRSTGEEISEATVERILGRPSQNELRDICLEIKRGNIVKAIEVTRTLFQHGIEPVSIAKRLLAALHQSLCQTVGVLGTKENFFSELSVPQLNRLWSMVHQSIQEINQSPLPKESCEVMILRLCHVSDIPPLKQLIEDMEQKMQVLQSSASSVMKENLGLEPDKPSTLKTLEDLIAWVENQRHPELAFFLKRDLRVHQFKPGYIECSLIRNEHQVLLRQLKELLQHRLSETWTFECIQLTAQEVPATVYEQHQQREAQEKDQALQSDLVQHALKSFSGASIHLERVQHPPKHEFS